MSNSSQSPSPFFEVSHTNGPGNVPESALIGKNDSISAMFPGDWAIPGDGAVWYDHQKESYFVDTFREVEPIINTNLLRRRPILLRSLGERGMHFVADFRKVTFPRAVFGTSNYGYDGDNQAYHRLQQTRGTELVEGVVYMGKDGPGYDGPDFLEEEAASFMLEVDAALGAQREHEVQTPTQDAGSVLELSPSFAHSPIGRAMRGLVDVVDRASQRSARSRR